LEKSWQDFYISKEKADAESPAMSPVLANEHPKGGDGRGTYCCGFQLTSWF
jgi:hypothetical protein